MEVANVGEETRTFRIAPPMILKSRMVPLESLRFLFEAFSPIVCTSIGCF